MTLIPSSKTGEGRVTVKDEGMLLSQLQTLNFTGAGVTATLNAGAAQIDIPGGGSSYVWPRFEAFYDALTQGFAKEINFTGDGVSVSLVGDQLSVTVPGGGDSGSTTPPTDTNYETAFNPKSTAYNCLGAADTTGGDTAKLQQMFTDATNNLPAIVTIPADTYYINGTISIPSSSDFQIPTISAVNTGTDVITMSTDHKKQTGDPIMFQGFMPAGLVAGTIYFVNKVSATTMKLYNSRANAITGGATGLIDITGGITTTGSITNGTAILTVAAELGLERGTNVRIAGVTNSNGGYYVIGGVGTGTLTLNANANATVSNVTVTYIGTMDWRYFPSGLKIVFQPGAIFKKTTVFANQAILNISLGSGVELKGGIFEGNTTDLNAGINAGDDLVRISSSHRILVEHCKFRHCGDAALRVQTSTADPQANTTSQPEGGVNSGEVVVRNNYFYNVHQFSSTTNDYVHGGTQNLFFYGNTMDNLRGSIKVANRSAGGRNMYMYANTFKSSIDKGFEIDSMENIYIFNNTFQNITSYAVYILSNNGPAGTGYGTGIVGFQYDSVFINNNIFKNCSSTGGTVRLQPDLYSDGTLINYRNVDISYNTFKDHTATGAIGINLINGNYEALTINNNKFTNWKGLDAIKCTLRGSTVSGFKNKIQINFNQIDMDNVGGSAAHIWLERTAGTEKLRNIQINFNQLTGSTTQAIVAGDWQKATLANNQIDLAAGNFFLRNSGTLIDLTVKNNEMTTGGTFGFNPTFTNGLYMYNNQFETASGTALSISNSNQNVWEFSNLVVGGSKQVAQVPVNTKSLSKVGRRDDGTASPTAGTWRVGDIVDFTNVAAAGSLGVYCITSGTAGTITATTGSITNGDDELTVSTVSGIAVGCYISIAGVTGTKVVTAINGLVVTLDSTADATVAAAAVAYVAPAFKALPTIAA